MGDLEFILEWGFRILLLPRIPLLIAVIIGPKKSSFGFSYTSSDP